MAWLENNLATNICSFAIILKGSSSWTIPENWILKPRFKLKLTGVFFFYKEATFLKFYIIENVIDVSVRFTSVQWDDRMSDKESEEFLEASKKIENAVRKIVYRSPLYQS